MRSQIRVVSDFGHTEIVKGAKNRVGLRRDFFKIPLNWSEKLVFEQFGGF